jgi:hypothetical protein
LEQQLRTKEIRDRMVHENSLDGDAGLAGIAESPDRTALRGDI